MGVFFWGGGEKSYCIRLYQILVYMQLSQLYILNIFIKKSRMVYWYFVFYGVIVYDL